MWNNSADNTIKIANMKGYVEGLYNTTLMASEGGGILQNEKLIYGEVAALLLPLVLALKRYDEEEFPMPEETDEK